MQQQYAVEMEGVSMRFGGVTALQDAHFCLKTGEIRGLVGKNGAGKSTLMKILRGLYSPLEGKIQLFGKVANAKTLEENISMIFQEFSLVPDMSVVQNVFLNSEPKRGIWIDDKKSTELIERFFSDIGLDIDPSTRLKHLSTSEMQMVEIAKAVLRQKKILLMDEPTAALESEQGAKLFELIRNLKRKGITIVLITHHLKEIMAHCDTVTVLRDGRVTATEDVSRVSLEEVISQMLGDTVYSAKQRPWRRLRTSEDPILEAKGIISAKKPKPVSLSVFPGEVVGLAGLKGSGRTEIFNALFGIDPITKGSLKLYGETVSIRSPRDAIDKGITLIPENRQTLGLSLAHSTYLNVQLPWMSRFRNGPFLNDRLGKELVWDLVEQLQIKTDSISASVSTLSGGNQQKVVIAKSLGAKPRIVLMDDPTYGVDIHAKAEIMKIIDAYTREGHAVVLVSSELEELLHTCDRVLVVKDGSIGEEYVDVLKGTLSEERLIEAIQ